MILTINNKSKNFYAHLGKIFGSREVERLTKDRIFDDAVKEWYLYYHKGTPDSFVSVSGNIIKNVWTYDRKHLVDTLKKVNKDLNIQCSTVTNYFREEYLSAGLIITEEKTNNFVIIRGNKNE